MATLTIPDQTLARLQAAAAARRVSLEKYLDQLAGTGADVTAVSYALSSGLMHTTVAERTAAAEAIRRLAAEIKDKATIEELIVDKHAGHKY